MCYIHGMNNIEALQNGIQILEKKIVIYDSKLTALEPWQQIALKSPKGLETWTKKNKLKEALQKAKAWDTVYSYVKQTDE